MDPQVEIWSDKVSNVAQIGGIETSVLDNGLGRGVRIAWINTGSGLRCKVVIDRAMDIADTFYNQYSLTWLNHPGIAAPQPFSHRGVDWLRTFGGGLVTTCGLSHVGGPEADEWGERGLHGMVSNIPAEIESIIQPDPARGIFTMSITGIIKQTQIFGPSLELRRTISATLGKSSIQIHDEVINRGNVVAPHMLLYHCNFGWPLVDEGAIIHCKGEKLLQKKDENNSEVVSTDRYKICPAPQVAHNGSGQEVDFIDIAADKAGNCICGIQNQKIGIAVTLQFPKKQLPWLTNWQHWSKGEYVTGIEPGTHPPIGQAKAREEGSLILMEPGETRLYDLAINVLTDETSIQSFINNV
jgi:hypothetical protein